MSDIDEETANAILTPTTPDDTDVLDLVAPGGFGDDSNTTNQSEELSVTQQQQQNQESTAPAPSQKKPETATTESNKPATPVRNDSSSLELPSRAASPNGSVNDAEPLMSDTDYGLEVRVLDPKKHSEGGPFSSSFVAYTVQTKTTRENFSSHELNVLRRYSDFIWLREQMSLRFCGHIIPPLPPKHNLKSGKTADPKFIETRRRGLERFIRRIAEHPVLSHSKCLRVFLESQAHEFTTAKKETETGVLDDITSSAGNLTTKLLVKISPEPRFADMLKYANSFESVMGDFESATVQMTESAGKLSTVSTDFAAALRKLAESERNIVPLISDMQNVYEKEHELMEKYCETLKASVLEPAQDFVQYAECIREALKRRDQVERDRQLVEQLFTEKKQERATVDSDDQRMSMQAILGRKPEEVKQEKLLKIDGELEELGEATESWADNLEVTNEAVNADMTNWRNKTAMDSLQMITNQADLNVEHLSEMMKLWDGVVEKHK